MKVKHKFGFYIKDKQKEGDTKLANDLVFSSL